MPQQKISISTFSNNEQCCTAHPLLPIQFVCSLTNCIYNRKICEQCRQKDYLHIQAHKNYILKAKQFFEFPQSKSVIPRLERGVQDLQTYIHKHKAFYEEQISKINSDFSCLINKFKEITQDYQKIYLQTFEKEIKYFDQDFTRLANNMKNYVNQKNNQQSFFNKLFISQQKYKDIDYIIQKNSLGFQVRCGIINLKSKITASKVAQTTYKATDKEQKKFNAMIQNLQIFGANFYDKMKDLLSSNKNVASSAQKINLRSSIISQTKSLSVSRVSECSSKYLDQESRMQRSMMVNPLQKTRLPQAHPKVLQIKKYLKPFPNLSQTTSRQQGPFKYQTGTYLGSYQNGLRSGKGIFIYDDGSYYQGNWQSDNMYGYGRLIKPNSYYQGEIKDGFAHGKGYFQDFQKTYSGDWRNDQRHGIGEEQFKHSKHKYVGMFASDKYDGKGKFKTDQFTYEGDFKQGFFHGEANVKYVNAQHFKGSFKDNQRIYGTHTFPDGSYYHGAFKDNLPSGNGELYWPDGIKYSGQWINGLQSGVGIQTQANGKQLKGLWQNGSWIKWL